MAEKYAPFPGAVCLEPGSELLEKLRLQGKKRSLDVSYAQTQIRRRKQEEEHETFLKEYNAYLKQWNDSEGFDLDFVPDELEGGPYVVNDLKHCYPGFLESARGCAMFAIDHENEQKGSKTKLEFVELVKFNLLFSVQEKYYLTFRAKNKKDGSVSAYQALVTTPKFKKKFKQGETKVLKFRERKPSTHELSKGVESLRMDGARDVASSST